MTAVILLFGEMGTGKSYWGEKIAEVTPNSVFVEGDTYVPYEMSKRVSRMLPPKREHIVEIVDRLQITPWYYEEGVVIISQALYRNEDRERLITAWEGYGYTVYPVWVRVPFWQNLRQLWKRERGGLKWVLYWLMNKPFFQKPTHGYQDPRTFFGPRDA